MKKSILITGVAGSGKSTISRKLNEIGLRAYDIESISGLYSMLDEDTGKSLEGYNNGDLKKVRKGKWTCNLDKLKRMIEGESAEVAFYCGTGSNIEEAVTLFDQIILLKANSGSLNERLAARKPGDFGSTEEVRKWVIRSKDKREKWFEENGAAVVSTDRPLEEVIVDIRRVAKIV